MVGRFFDKLLSAFDICDDFKETALDFEEFQRVFVASADGHLIIILDVVFVDVFYFFLVFLFDFSA